MIPCNEIDNWICIGKGWIMRRRATAVFLGILLAFGLAQPGYGADDDARAARVRSGLATLLNLRCPVAGSVTIAEFQKAHPDARDVTPIAFRDTPGKRHFAIKDGERTTIMEFDDSRLRCVQFLLKT